jgi:prepilin-type N-terminal cleavage/methylation domain-containing protein
MGLSKKQSGFSAVEIIIVAAVVAIVGYLGYSFYTSYQDKQSKAAESATTDDTTRAPEITTTTGLDEASATIDQADVESSNNDDLSELEKEMSDL